MSIVSKSTISINWIPVLKGLLCLGIFVYHLGNTQFQIHLGSVNFFIFNLPLPPGPQLADAFIFIAGYLVGIKFINQSFSLVNILNYIKKRLMRLLPSYILVLLASYYILRQYVIPHIMTYILNMILIQGSKLSILGLNGDPQWVSKTNAPLWFVSVIIPLYFVSPFMYYILRFLKKYPYILYMSAMFVGFVVRYMLLPSTPWQFKYYFEIYQLSFLGNILFFLTGIGLAFVVSYQKSVRNVKKLIYSFIGVFTWWFITGYDNCVHNSAGDDSFTFKFYYHKLASYTHYVNKNTNPNNYSVFRIFWNNFLSILPLALGNNFISVELFSSPTNFRKLSRDIFSCVYDFISTK